MPRHIGIDFDNTIVCYDAVFYEVAREKGWVPSTVPPTKEAVRGHLRGVGREEDWTMLQGMVYGERMAAARAFPGVENFMVACAAAGLTVSVISYKTRFPFRGERVDLHAAARDWLESHGVHDRWRLPRDRVFFELTKEAKLARIAAEGCDLFIDDLPELLGEKAFPSTVTPVLFDPNGAHENERRFQRAGSWKELAAWLAP